MKLSWNRFPVDDFAPNPNRGAGILALFTAIAFVAICTGSVQFHSPAAKANDSGENNMGGSGVPGAAGYNPTFHLEEENYGRPGRFAAVSYGMFPPAVAQYVVGAHNAPYGAFAQARHPQVVALNHGLVVAYRRAPSQPKHIGVIVHRPLDILPPIAVARQPQTKMPTFASTLFGIQ